MIYIILLLIFSCSIKQFVILCPHVVSNTGNSRATGYLDSKGGAMFYTLTFDGDRRILEDHATLAGAEAFARDVAAEGRVCALLRTLSTVAAELRETEERYYGLTAGIDFPGSLSVEHFRSHHE